MKEFNFYARGQSLIGIILVLVIVGLISGGLYYYFQRQIPEAPEITEESSEEKNPPEPSSLAQVFLSSNSLEQGDTLFIKVVSQFGIDEPTGRLSSEAINFFEPAGGKEWWGIVGIDVKMEPGMYDLIVDFSGGDKFRQQVNVIKRKFPITELLVTKELKEKGYSQEKIVEDITTKENLILKKILDVYTPKAYFNKAFVYPLEKIKDVGAFGNIRKYGDLALQHLGVDLDATVGTPVYAINDGMVCFSGELNTYGKTLIVDHGLGIFSLYLHLSKFNVLNDERIERGDIIGLSGNTGYSIAPHLHFSVKVNKTGVDPLRFIRTIEKETIR